MQRSFRRPVVAVRGYPGPTWSMALWALLYLAGALVNGLSGAPLDAWLPEVVVELVVFVLVLSFPQTRREWLPKVLAGVQIALVYGMVATAERPVDQLATALVWLVAVLYVGAWWPGRWSYVVAALCSVLYLTVVLWITPEQDLLSIWFTFSAATFGIAFGLQIVIVGISRRATVDPLTGTLNRAALDDYVSFHDVKGRELLPRTLMLIDLDGLKRFNDEYGHVAGDDLLRRCVEAWRPFHGSDDSIFRIGGDEFVLILHRRDLAASHELAAHMAAASPAAWSYGLAEWGPDRPFSDAFAEADWLLYQQKGSNER